MKYSFPNAIWKRWLYINILRLLKYLHWTNLFQRMPEKPVIVCPAPYAIKRNHNYFNKPLTCQRNLWPRLIFEINGFNVCVALARCACLIRVIKVFKYLWKLKALALGNWRKYFFFSEVSWFRAALQNHVFIGCWHNLKPGECHSLGHTCVVFGIIGRLTHWHSMWTCRLTVYLIYEICVLWTNRPLRAKI